MKVFISTTTFGQYDKEPLQILKKRRIDYRLNPYKRRLSKDEIGTILNSGSYGGLIAGTEPLTKDVLEGASGPLRVISRVGVGLEDIDLDTARRLNIRVYNTPDVLTDSVAELTMGLILSSLRKITSMDRKIRQGEWRKEMGSLLKAKTLGIIGFGRIGKRVARLVRPFGADIVFYDIKRIKDNVFKQVSLDRLLKISDIISIHSATKERLINKNKISKMKRNALLINTSRGSVIDESALYKALKSGRVACAALDVYGNEPYSGKLTSLDNTILTPHVGSYARESRIAMEIKAVENLIKGFKEVRLL